MNRNVLVVIPIYKLKPSDDEACAINNNISKLKQYDICFIGPSGLNTSNYPIGGKIRYEAFPKKYFSGIRGYNKLMLSKDFYSRFREYQYTCICQTDVWIIKDGNCLDEFIESKLDYIGAPWLPYEWLTLIPKMNKFKNIVNFINSLFPRYKLYVGNGGFSLRKNDSFIRVIDKYKRLWYTNEDVFFSYIGKYKDEKFKVAGVEVARRFALEKESKQIIEQEKIIPVGVHAYMKFYPEVCDELYH